MQTKPNQSSKVAGIDVCSAVLGGVGSPLFWEKKCTQAWSGPNQSRYVGLELLGLTGMDAGLVCVNPSKRVECADVGRAPGLGAMTGSN
ncbi:hypothetical protein V6N12_022794 [Hibiscus sabdariffa]|uniref:Uncharacterized protein n=1 Tax=Hibiscus sabdariffa TaxID=183260 RepID=A0ABR2FWK1_9ROSI